MATLTCPSPLEIKPLIGSGNYTFSTVKFPDITFMVKEVELPSIELGEAIMPTAVNDIPVPGDTLKFAPLTCTFVVDEKMTNYLVLNDWMVAMGFPEDHDMYRDLIQRSSNSITNTELSKGYTDAVLTILGNNNMPLIQAFFADCFPISLSGLRFSSGMTDASPMTADVTFVYSYYSMRIAR